VLRVRLFYLFLTFLWSDGLHSKLSEAILRVIPVGESGHHSLYRTVAIIANDHVVIDGLQLVYVAAFGDLLQVGTQLCFVVSAPPPQHVHVVRLRALRFQHERRHKFRDERLAVFETRGVQDLQVKTRVSFSMVVP